MKIFLGPTIIWVQQRYRSNCFLRRFITPLGLLGFEELAYEIIDWSTDFFVANIFQTMESHLTS